MEAIITADERMVERIHRAEARIAELEEGLRLYREFFKAVVERSPKANAAPLIAWERKQEGGE